MFTPETEAYKSLGGLIAIGSIFPDHWSWIQFWHITAFLSIVLAIMNILPIPALDGGHVLFLLVEVVTGRRPSDKFLERAQMDDPARAADLRQRERHLPVFHQIAGRRRLRESSEHGRPQT